MTTTTLRTTVNSLGSGAKQVSHSAAPNDVGLNIPAVTSRWPFETTSIEFKCSNVLLLQVSKKRKHQDDTSVSPPSKKMCQPLKHEIYVGGLPEDTSIKQIKKHFSSFGEVADVFVPKKLDSKGLKYVFVSFKEASSLQQALEAKEHKVRWLFKVPRGYNYDKSCSF